MGRMNLNWYRIRGDTLVLEAFQAIQEIIGICGWSARCSWWHGRCRLTCVSKIGIQRTTILTQIMSHKYCWSLSQHQPIVFPDFIHPGGLHGTTWTLTWLLTVIMSKRTENKYEGALSMLKLLSDMSPLSSSKLYTAWTSVTELFSQTRGSPYS